MHDCSRNGPVNITQAKEMIMVAALFGLNRFMLYTEDVYENNKKQVVSKKSKIVISQTRKDKVL